LAENEKAWVDYRCDEYKKNVDLWKFQEDHFSTKKVLKNVRNNARKLTKWIGREWTITVDELDGTVKQYSGQNNLPSEYRFSDPNKDYLARRPAERLENYIDRSFRSSYTNHPKRIIKTIVGQISGVDNSVIWQPEDQGEGLRSVNLNGKTIDVGERLDKDCDGDGTSWDDKWEQIVTQTLIYDKGYVFVSGKGENAHVRFIEPKRVVNKRYRENGDLVEVLVLNEYYTTDSLKNEKRRVEEYHRYTLDGFEIYQKNDEGEVEPVKEDEWREYEFYKTKNREVKILPVIELELVEDFGYSVAEKSNDIFQTESETYHRYRMMMETILGVDSEDEAFRQLQKTMMEGGRVVQGKPSFEAPPGEPVQIGLDVVERLVEDLYTTLFLEYGNSAREKSATEIRQDYQTGLVSLLTTVQEKSESFENQVLWLIEQIYYPNSTRLWGQAKSDRSTDFQPKNEEEAISLIKNTFFDMQDVPLPEAVKARLVSKMLEMIEVEFEEDEILQKAQEDELITLQENQSVPEQEPVPEGVEQG
jgi:hypothetical protein